MKKALFIVALLFSLFSCGKKAENMFRMNNLYAWCVVPFDIKERSPQERIQMLTRLGFQKYAYDWREKHLPEMAGEWKLAEKSGVKVMSVWMWIDRNSDAVGRLSAGNEKVWQALKETGIKTQVWVSFHPNFFENLSEQDKVKKGAEMVGYLAGRADSLSCRVALYNHGDWFGDPANQIRIIGALPQYKLGLIYNFHHAHEQFEAYPRMVDEMLPYLWAVNLNGMKKEGPKILPIGKGDLEQGMISLLLAKGYSGPFGILGHVEDADVELILRENLSGLAGLSKAQKKSVP